ncbi:uncharacterized protein [Temnothorax nylanderi]|uniref:uncharacterized protein n=1 Tax=Temnothorax nylanderi TaxID=102681 RepID=UPI003A8BEFDD
MKDSKGVSVPADPNAVLYPVESDKELENSVPYREAVGSLMFLAIVSRSDIAYAVNSVSRYLNRHSRSHWQAVKRIFAYLVTTISVGKEYSAFDNKLELVGFSDADYAGDIETRRSTTGYVFILANGAVTWSSQRQKLVSMSTTESEYIAASCAAREFVWLRNLLNGIGHRCVKPTVLHDDNQSTFRLVKNPQFHKRTKHIDVRYYYIREKVENDEIVVEYVRTECQRADVFTKALAKDLFKRMCTSIGLCEE